MKRVPERRLHMGCGEPLSGLIAGNLLRPERRQLAQQASRQRRRFLRRASDK